MKKFFVSILATMMGFGAFAQEVAPNRILISDKSYNTKGYIVDNVEAITFATVEGEVAADVEILEVTSEALSVKVLRTEACQAFKLNVLPTVQIQNYSDAALVSAVDASTTNLYYQDFPSGLLDITSFEPNTAYTVVTVGFDMYGVPVEARKADFTTLATPIVGTPAVEVEVVDIQKSQFTLKFTPNADTSRYALCAGEKGTMQSQYEMFAPMFGYSNFGQMLEAWGVGFDEATEYTWTNMNPGTEYEVFIQTWDVNGTMADYSVYTVTTESYGGEGTAEVAITIGKYELADWWGEMLPSQFITFTPNDQSSAYRFSVYTAEVYDADADAIKAELCSEPPMPTSGWFFYETITTDYQIDPNTECVAIAAAKNVNNEWGPIAEVRFTTPADAANPNAAPSKAIKKRVLQSVKQRAGVAPAIKSNEFKLIAR